MALEKSWAIFLFLFSPYELRHTANRLTRLVNRLKFCLFKLGCSCYSNAFTLGNNENIAVTARIAIINLETKRRREQNTCQGPNLSASLKRQTPIRDDNNYNSSVFDSAWPSSFHKFICKYGFCRHGITPSVKSTVSACWIFELFWRNSYNQITTK